MQMKNKITKVTIFYKYIHHISFHASYILFYVEFNASIFSHPIFAIQENSVPFLIHLQLK